MTQKYQTSNLKSIQTSHHICGKATNFGEFKKILAKNELQFTRAIAPQSQLAALRVQACLSPEFHVLSSIKNSYTLGS